MKDTGILIIIACIFIALTVCQITITANDTVSVVVSVDANVSETPSSKAPVKDELININTASESLLCKIPGIGEVRASKIIEYRKINGNFGSIEELLNVSGIGEITLEKIRKYITV